MTQGIVTPEAVVLEFDTGGVGSRLIGGVIDLAARVALFVALSVGLAFIGAVVRPIGIAGVFVALFLTLFGYPIAFETLWRGRTPGKAAMGLRVVTVEGAPIGFRHAAIRALLGLVDFYLTSGGAAVLAILLSPRNQRLGDMVAGTLVVRERTGAAQPLPVNFGVPYGYEQYAASLDVTGLSAADYGAVRSFLLRAASLDPHRRWDLARQIATPLLGRLRHSPPPWVGPEAMLACVAVAYQARQRQAAGAAYTPPGSPYPPPAPSYAPPAPSSVPPAPPAVAPAPIAPADGYTAPS